MLVLSQDNKTTFWNTGIKSGKNEKGSLQHSIINTVCSAIAFILAIKFSIVLFNFEVQNHYSSVFQNYPKEGYQLSKIDNNNYEVLSNNCINESIEQGRSYVNVSIDISQCVFYRYSKFIGDGGVIFVNGGSYSMVVSFSTFFNCSCSSNGGAIYFSSFSSVLKRICANKCAAINKFFAYIESNQLNQAEFLSISMSKGNCFPIYLNDGNQKIDNSNISMNIVYLNSGAYF